jgi:CBS domain-containing protein
MPSWDSKAHPVMKASDVMTAEVVSIRPDAPVKDIAKVLLKNSISAVPVIDENGSPIGMVSEGDLLPRPEPERAARRDWWLALLAEGETLSSDFVASLNATNQMASDIMSSPVVSVVPDTDLAEIARLLADYRIKRVPVVQDGHVVGIVSRADLLRALADQPHAQSPTQDRGFLAGALAALDEHFLHTRHPNPTGDGSPPRHREPPGDHLAVGDFRHAMTEFGDREKRQREDARRAAAENRQHHVTELLGEHVSDGRWHALLRQAQQAAEHGEKEFLLVRFPSQLCTDGGRAINVPDPNWPATLQGEAAEIYVRWHTDLKPGGFHLVARILNFPDGILGDVGLFLVWETESGT